MQNAILDYAADSGADFIVMGGYGHSRLREFILGGVTRSILQVDDGAGADVALSRASTRSYLLLLRFMARNRSSWTRVVSRRRRRSSVRITVTFC